MRGRSRRMLILGRFGTGGQSGECHCAHRDNARLMTRCAVACGPDRAVDKGSTALESSRGKSEPAAATRARRTETLEVEISDEANERPEDSRAEAQKVAGGDDLGSERQSDLLARLDHRCGPVSAEGRAVNRR